MRHRLPIDDNTKLTAQQYRERLYAEITNRRRDARAKEQERLAQQAKNEPLTYTDPKVKRTGGV